MFTVKREHIFGDLTYIQRKKKPKNRQYIDFFLIKLILEHLNKMCCKTSNFMHDSFQIKSAVILAGEQNVVWKWPNYNHYYYQRQPKSPSIIQKFFFSFFYLRCKVAIWFVNSMFQQSSKGKRLLWKSYHIIYNCIS